MAWRRRRSDSWVCIVTWFGSLLRAFFGFARSPRSRGWGRCYPDRGTRASPIGDARVHLTRS
ncbi:hypothetical protein N136_02067 [Leifsonia aquatica ATCC 14665]|uniref:Uncharacterized protein n=1 Tax=Leifsonia aquatica ATCC 14665 TaxID=1358026 RepID=U2R8K1_LEIAQ|nr:hypothetical protein N136_02067 [Leifsonia aquatica ATCC 14665]